MLYKKYQIEISDPRGNRYTITINELYLLILCFVADGLPAPVIKKRLEKLNIVKNQETIEGYIQKLKTDIFQLKPPGRTGKCRKEELTEAAIRFGLIAERDGRHVIIIEETLAALKQAEPAGI